uniref:Uncharacterized protein n=1 Tax=Scleropages formosus TaxID=113540 RepID=A0A8C9RL30_SCLFO
MLSFLQPPSHCRTKSKWQKSKSAEIQSTSSLMKVKYGAEGGKNQEFCKIYVFSVFLAKGAGITYRPSEGRKFATRKTLKHTFNTLLMTGL